MGWRVIKWFKKGHLTGGYGNIDGTSQQDRERLWASPHCLADAKPLKAAGLFDEEE